MSAGSIAIPESREEADVALRWTAAARLLGVVLQLGLAVLVIRQFKIEGPAFTKLAVLVFAGFVVHALLPLAWRLTFFLALSVAGTGLFMGVTNGLWTLSIGVGLVLLVSLPLRFSIRLGLLLLAAVSLGIFRDSLLPSQVPPAVWPVLGSMFMFRLAIYLYDVRHGVEPGPLTRTMAYFFMVPNVAFPLFPVVDYKTYVRTYFDDDAWRIYQRGLRWIARGLLHLVLYRIIYHHMTMDLTEVRNGPQVVQYVFSSFMLYLRVSGMYHLAIGMLHLFGFRLPETNHFWLFCQSFTDLWRRMNIYVKDMMMKLVYYPSFFRFRRIGMRKAITLALILVFIATWALHSYQWFWLRSDWLLSWQDGLFYVFLGALVIWQSLKEAKPGRKRGLDTGVKRWSPKRSVNALLTMSTLMILWSFWTADSVDQWVAMWSGFGSWPLQGALIVLGCLVLFLALAGLPWRSPELAERKEPGMLRSALLTSGTLCGLFLLGQPALVGRASSRLATLMRPVQENQLNRRDNAAMLRGYYEKVDNEARLGTEVWQAEQDKPDEGVRITSTPIYHERDDFLGGELVPGARVMFKDKEFLTNRWGMHDQDYEREKPAGTLRITLLGPSDVMGPGVGADDTFEALVEARLNQEHAGGKFQRYEILNFGVAAFTVLQQAAMLQQRALNFQPDLVIMTLHPASDPPTSLRYLVDVVRAGRAVPYADLRELVQNADIDSTTKEAVAKRRMWPHVMEMMQWSLREVARTCREQNIPAILLVMDAINEESPAEQPLIRYADSLGFAIMDLRRASQGHDPATLMLAAWDRHPNQAGHRLLADAMYQRLEELGDSLGLGLK
ncbi:MAG TPA: hypothetical protein VGP80_14965 [Gemmatimonadales bacterium]|jgi:D-alanyl-lipoteichoic acid acyltransferase DltB (MBOAT superfamily)|nr:hypothetical protein [Gemmatimonadales bacterium]